MSEFEPRDEAEQEEGMGRKRKMHDEPQPDEVEGHMLEGGESPDDDGDDAIGRRRRR